MTNLDAILEKIRSLSPSERAEVYDLLVKEGWTELEQQSGTDPATTTVVPSREDGKES